MHITKRLFLAAAMAAGLVGSAQAADLDLNGVDTTVTDVASLAAYDGVTNSSDTLATLTFDVATDMAYVGAISGNIKVVKMGNGMLDLSGASTYTGGTQIDDGRLVASSLTAFGATTGAIQVNSDCNGYAQGTGYAQSNNVTCVAFNCAGEFAYPINTSAWKTPSAGPNGYGGVVYYNVAVMVQGVTLSGKITGGGLSVHFGGLDWDANASTPSGSGGLTISGDIDCGAGMCHFGSRGTAINVTGKVTALGIYQNAAVTWPPLWTLGNTGNSIGVIDVGGGASGDYSLTASAADALGGATVYSRAENRAKSNSVKIAADQTVESFSMKLDGSYAGGSLSESDLRHYIRATASATVSMMGTNNRTNDWLLKDDGATKAMSLVWNPTGDYTYTCVGHANTIHGTITVSGGTFEVGDSCSFPNVTAISVANAATLKVSSADVPFASSVTIDAERGATLDLAVDMTAESAMSGHNYLDAGDYPAGTYNGLTITGAGTLHVSTRPVMTQATLQAAINAVEDGGSVYVANDIALSSSLSVAKAGAFTLLSPEGTNYTLSITKESATATIIPALLMNHANATCRLENVTLSGDYANLTNSPVVMVDVGCVELGNGAVLEGGICGMWLHYRGATALMDDGAVIRNCYDGANGGYGFGVRVGWYSISSGPLGSDGPIPYFTMRGGAITNNACETPAWGSGGTVYVRNAVFEMTGGLIAGNRSSGGASGVWLNSGITTNYLGGTARILDNTGEFPGIAVHDGTPKVILRGDFRGKAAWSYPAPKSNSTIASFTIEEGATGVWNLFAVTNGVDTGWIGKTKENAPTEATWATPNGWIDGTAFASKEDAARSLPDALTVTADWEALAFSGEAAQATKSIALDFDADAIRASGRLPITLATSDEAFGGGLALNLPDALSEEWTVRRMGTSIVLDLRHPPTVISFR